MSAQQEAAKAPTSFVPPLQMAQTMPPTYNRPFDAAANTTFFDSSRHQRNTLPTPPLSATSRPSSSTQSQMPSPVSHTGHSTFAAASRPSSQHGVSGAFPQHPNAVPHSPSIGSVPLYPCPFPLSLDAELCELALDRHLLACLKDIPCNIRAPQDQVLIVWLHILVCGHDNLTTRRQPRLRSIHNNRKGRRRRHKRMTSGRAF